MRTSVVDIPRSGNQRNRVAEHFYESPNRLHGFGTIHSTVDLCGFCVLSQHREMGGVKTIHMVKIAVHSAEGCCTAATISLTSINQKL